MARSFAPTIPLVPYIGVPYSKSIALCDPTRRNSKMVPLQIDWLSYGASSNRPDIGVVVNLQGGGVVPTVISAVMSVFIDNTENNTPIYVAFPDTGFVAVCAPNSSIFLPVITQGVQCVVYSLGMATGQIPNTLIFLFDTIIQGFQDLEQELVFPQWLQSLNSQRAYNLFSVGYGSPALGESILTDFINPSDATPQGMFNSPRASGFFVLTSVECSVSALKHTTSNSSLGFQIKSTGPSGGLMFWNYGYLAGTFIPYAILSSLTGLQLRLDATEQWQWLNLNPWPVVGAQGQAQLKYMFTYVP